MEEDVSVGVGGVYVGRGRLGGENRPGLDGAIRKTGLRG